MKSTSIRTKMVRYFIAIITIFLVIPLATSAVSFLNNDIAVSNDNGIGYTVDENIVPNSSYLPINLEGHLPVGNITLLEITEMAVGNFSRTDHLNDYLQHRFEYTYNGYELIDVVSVASEDNIDWNLKKSYITILVNESVTYKYFWNYTVRYITYISELSDTGILKEVALNNSLIDVELMQPYSGGYYFDIEDYYNENNNGTLNFSFLIEYNLTLTNWFMSQRDMSTFIGNQYLLEEINQVEGYYNYSMSFGSSGLNFTGRYLVNLPDANSIDVINLNTYTGSVLTPTVKSFTAYTKYSNNSIEFVYGANATMFSINFNTTHTLQFSNINSPNYWSTDSLYDGLENRKRTFEITCTDGPETIPISNFLFNETTIPFGQGLSVASELGRPVGRGDMNYTNSEGVKVGPAGTTLRFLKTSETTYYYLVKGETDKITYSYKASNSLNLLIFDKANLPVRNAEIRLSYQGVTYGTFMSASETLKIAPKFTDEQGQIILEHLPYGNFTISIYYNGEFIQNFEANTETSIYVFYSEIPHFPLWILIFSGISIALMVSGLYLYKKNSK